MRSNVCRITKEAPSFRSILQETEKVTAYNALVGRDALSLRLLSEELVSMLPSIVQDFEGVFWIEADGADYELHVELSVENMDLATRDTLISVSRTRKNASAVGITGKIRAVFDYMVMGGDEAAVITPPARYGFATSMDYSYLWSLRAYESGVPESESEEKDEFERSIIAKLADDVIVGVKGKKVYIIIKKSFKEENK